MVNPRQVVDYRSMSMHLKAGEKCLVGVSGGPDSVCLLHALSQLRGGLGCELEVVHVNHLVRGARALEDYQFVKAQCERLEVPCHYREIEPLARKARGVTTEEYLRKQRHESMFEVARLRGIRKIALGHNADDLAETFLMHLMRGTGLQGLAFSFAQRRHGMMLLRPLWQTSRRMILDYLLERGVGYCEDETNRLPDYTRNRVRHVLVPVIEREFNPSIGEALRRTSRVISYAEEYLRATARRKLRVLLKRSGDASALPLRGFLALPAILQYEVAREWLRKAPCRGARAGFEQVEALVRLAHAGQAHQIPLSDGVTVVRSEERLVLVAPSQSEAPGLVERHAVDGLALKELARRHLAENPSLALAEIASPLRVESLAQGGFEAQLTLLDGSTARLAIQVVSQQELACVEPVRDPGFLIEPPLFLRNRQAGDRVSPSVRLKSVLINDKVPYYVRDFLVLVANARGRVVAVVGMPRVNARIQAGWEVRLQAELRGERAESGN